MFKPKYCHFVCRLNKCRCNRSMIDQKIGNFTSNIGLSILLHKNLFVCYQMLMQFYKFLFHDFLPLKAFTCRFLQSLWIFKACLLFYLLCTERFPLILKSNKIYCLISYLKFIFLVKVVK